jgi:hypothetical protein
VIDVGSAFSFNSRVFSIVPVAITALNLQAVADDESDDTKPFFFTGEARSEIENKELRRVFVGAESLQQNKENNLNQGPTPPQEKEPNTNIERERETLERLFRI